MKTKTRISTQKLRPFSLVLILLIQIILPFQTPSIDLEEGDEPQITSARNPEPDINITAIEWIGPSYFDPSGGGTDILAPASQQVRITLVNDGLATAPSVTLQFDVDRNDGSGWQLEGNTILLDISPGEVINYIFTWTPIMGTDQAFRAFASPTDADSTNNLRTKDFDVDIGNFGDVYSDTLPPGGTRLAKEDAIVSVGVRNAGNIETEATTQLIFSPTSGGPAIEFFSNPTILAPGSIAAPAEVELSSMVIDGANLSGEYIMSGYVHFNSTIAPADVIAIGPRVIFFSQYRTTIVPPSDRAVEPGNSASLTFIIQNVGEMPDRYNITVTDIRGWADTAGIPSQTPIIAAASSTVVVVPVSVPLGTDRSLSDMITLEIESEGGDYFISESSAVMAGDILQGTLNHTTWNVPIIPGQPETIQYTLNNTGTSPATFNLTTGFSQVAPGWQASIYPTTTPYMTVGEEIIVTVHVVPPPLALPFDPTTKLAEGNSLELWTNVQPIEGGAPNIQETVLEVQPTVMVELMAEQTEFFADLSEIGTGPITRFCNIEMELRHNLINTLGSTVDIELNATPSGFNPTRSSVGVYESLRWNGSITPDNSTLAPGETQSILATILGPSDLLPLAGIVSVDIVANLTLSGALSGVQAPETTLTLTLEVPELTAANIEIPAPTIVVPEVESSVVVSIFNVGNHKTNLTYLIGGPEGWIVSVTPTSKLDLGSNIDLWPSLGFDNTTVTVEATAPAHWRADSIPSIQLTVVGEDGQNITQADIPFFVQELIDASLTPAVAVAVLAVNSTETIVLKATNEGNSLQNFSMIVDDALADINLRIISNSSEWIEPGEFTHFIIEVDAGPFARADQNHSALATLFHDGIPTAQTDIYVEILPNHNITFEHHTEFSVIPGKEASIAVNLTNMGNVVETVNFSTILPADWSAEVNPETVTIQSGGIEVVTVNLVVHVPAMSSGSGPVAGTIHDLTLIARNTTDDEEAGSTVIRFTTEPIFDIEADDFPQLIELLPDEVRTFDVNISNAGNQDVSLDITCDVGATNRWLVSNCAQANYSLDIGETRTISFTVQNIASDPYNGEQAGLSLTFSPRDNHSGDRFLSSQLRMVRIWAEPVYKITGESTLYPIEINWAHVQSVGQTADTRAIDYELRLLTATRLINASLYEGDLTWSFELGSQSFIPSNETIPRTIMFPNANPLQINTLDLKVSLPSSELIPPGDGWILVFELIHTEEGNSTATQMVLNLTVTNWADPAVTSISIDGSSSFEESKHSTLIAVLENNGNAPTLPNLVAELECGSGITILDPTIKEGISLSAHEKYHTLEWSVKSDALSWWTSSEDIQCTVTLTSGGLMAGDLDDNNAKTQEISLDSWTLPLVLLIPLTVVLILASSRLLRRAREDERALMLSAYSGSVLLGVVTQFGLGAGPNFGLAAAALIWTAIITAHTSGFEFPSILSDRQNHLRGGESIVEDHEAELRRVARQLRLKLTFAPLGFILTVLIMPNNIAWTIENIGVTVLYLIASALFVDYMIRRVQGTWLSIFDQLTMVELESRDLLKQLGTPSTDLRKITIGQRWGESHDVNVEVEGNV